MYVCVDENCSYTADRDANAARNILLRYLTIHGITLAPQCANGQADTVHVRSLIELELVQVNLNLCLLSLYDNGF